MDNVTCKCGNGACQVRIARGLSPFCRLEAKPAPERKKPCKACASRPWAHGVVKCWHTKAGV